MVGDSQALALEARNLILQMTHDAKASHVGSSLSVVDILAVIYSDTSSVGQIKANSPERDCIVLSKGHAAAALYSVLALQEFIPMDWVKDYCADGSFIGGHVTSKGIPAIELSTGSLGHGLPYGLGIAMAKKMDNRTGTVIIVMSDGECDEGTTWESALIANHFNLDNLVVIIDRNRIQSLGDTESTIKLEPLDEKFRAFGWEVHAVNGHNHSELRAAIKSNSDRPKLIIANTTKGKGVSFMENSVLWHYKWPNDEQLAVAHKELSKEK